MGRASQDAEAHLVEIFASPQGEGPWVGVPTIFVRFGGCDLRCAWCDSPNTWLRGETCRIERAPGSERFETRSNPVPVAAVEQAIVALAPPGQGFVSLTGGEPLLQPAAAGAVATAARARGLRVHLETHGLATEALASVVDHVDVVSMDWKLPSEVGRTSETPAEPFAERHAAFLQLAAERAQVFVKVVLTAHTSEAELDAACEVLAACSPETLLVLQPATPVTRKAAAPSARQVLAAQRRCGERLADVRVIPQTHRAYGAL